MNRRKLLGILPGDENHYHRWVYNALEDHYLDHVSQDSQCMRCQLVNGGIHISKQIIYQETQIFRDTDTPDIRINMFDMLQDLDRAGLILLDVKSLLLDGKYEHAYLIKFLLLPAQQQQQKMRAS